MYELNENAKHSSSRMSSSARTVIIILTIMLFVAVIALVVLAVLFVEREKDKDDETTKTTDSPDIAKTTDSPDHLSFLTKVNMTACDDIAIIGAGIAGSYAAWRLRNQDKKITVYEYSNRIGGRCHTVKFPGIQDVHIEMGPMRFIPLIHPLINRTLHELGLTVSDFDTVGVGFNPDSLIYVRGKHMRYKNLDKIQVPYNLEEHMRTDFDQLNWEIFANNTDINPDLEGYMDDTRKIKTKDGVDLWKQSRQGYYFKFVNADTAKYLQDVGHWDGDYGDVSAAQTIPLSKPAPNTRILPPVKTVDSGFQSIPEHMIEEFLNSSGRHSFLINRHLKSILKQEDKYILMFQPTVTVNGETDDVKPGHHLSSEPSYVCAKKVILAVGRQSLEHLEWDGLKQPDVQDYMLNSVFDVHAGKMYFASETDWWAQLDPTPHLTVSDTPLRQTFNFAKSKAPGNYILNAGYMDSNPYVSFWRELKKQGTRYPGTDDDTVAVSTYTVKTARKFLAEIYNVTLEDIPAPKYAVMSLWDSYPYGASWYSWRPGYDWDQIQSKMIRPSATDDIFVSSNAFSAKGNSGWVEGALEMVELVMKYFES